MLENLLRTLLRSVLLHDPLGMHPSTSPRYPNVANYPLAPALYLWENWQKERSHLDGERSQTCQHLSSFICGNRPLINRPLDTARNHHYFSKNIAIHLQFVLQYASNLYCSTTRAPTLWGKGSTVRAPPICVAIRLPFLSQYFWEGLGGCGHRDVPQTYDPDSRKTFSRLLELRKHRGNLDWIFIWKIQVIESMVSGLCR